jgi:hypothetical protein
MWISKLGRESHFDRRSILDSAIMPRRWRNFLPTETGLRGWGPLLLLTTSAIGGRRRSVCVLADRDQTVWLGM